MKQKLDEFYKIAKLLNQQNITPLLYGSLGLNYEIKANYDADDIDILIPEEYLENKWEQLKTTIERKTTYKLVDLKEHTFFDGTNKISLAKFGDLVQILKTDAKNLRTEFCEGAQFLTLNAEQFLRVYEFTASDQYRKKIGKNVADEQKVHRIKEYLTKQELEIEYCQFVPATITEGEK